MNLKYKRLKKRQNNCQRLCIYEKLCIMHSNYDINNSEISDFTDIQCLLQHYQKKIINKIQCSVFFFFSFRPFPSILRPFSSISSHSVLSFSKPSCLQRPSPSHQPPPYPPSPHLKIFSLVSLFSFFPATPFPSSFFLHILGLSS